MDTKLDAIVESKLGVKVEAKHGAKVEVIMKVKCGTPIYYSKG